MSRFGYTTASGVEIPPMIDMIDGGGPGRSGEEFEGAGILSLLANMVADPYGSVRPRPGYVEEDIVMRGTQSPADISAPETETSIEEISPRAASEEDVATLQRIGGPEYFDLQPGDLLSITEVQMIEEAGPVPPPADPMMTAPQMSPPQVDTRVNAPFGMDPFLFAPRTAPTAPSGGGIIPGAAVLP